jgi:hypothetical protein
LIHNDGNGSHRDARTGETITMSTDVESVGKVQRAKRAVGSILNLLRYQPVATLKDAETRLRLLDEFAVEALVAIDDLESTEVPRLESSTTSSRPSPTYVGPGLAEAESHLGTRH